MWDSKLRSSHAKGLAKSKGGKFKHQGSVSIFREKRLHSQSRKSRTVRLSCSFLLHHGKFGERFRSRLFKGLQIPKAAPLAADRSRRNPNNTKSAGGEPKQSGGLFWRGEPSPGVPRCTAQIPFSVKRIYKRLHLGLPAFDVHRRPIE